MPVRNGAVPLYVTRELTNVAGLSRLQMDVRPALLVGTIASEIPCLYAWGALMRFQTDVFLPSSREGQHSDA